MITEADTKLRVFHLISSLDIGGTEMQLAKLLARTDRTRFEHCVVSLINVGPVGEMIRAQGVPVYSLGMRRSVPSLSAVWRLWNLIRTERPLILQTWLYHADLLGLLVGKLAGVPVLWSLRCSLVDMQYYPKLSQIVVRILSRLSAIPDAVVVNSEAGRQAHTLLGYRPRRFEFIPNGFELDQFRPDASAREWLNGEFQLSKDAVIIGLVARYDPMKDHRTFLTAAWQLHDKYPEAHFILCGNLVDEQNKDLMRLMKDYDLSHCVRLLGPRQDIPRITAALDIACSSSAFGEGFCNAIGEAMSCGVPCVVTDVGDSTKIVGPTGKVVPPRNPEAFANALSELIACGAEGRHSLGMQARARIAEQFDINAMAVRYEQLYLSLSRTVPCAVVQEETRPSHS